MLTRRSVVNMMAGAVAGTPSRLPAQTGGQPTAFALIGDRYHNSDYIRTALGKTLVSALGLSIDFTDEIRALSADRLSGYKLLIVFRDGWVWPDGYPDEMTYPGYAQRASAGITSYPPVPKHEAKSSPWITAEQGRAVREFALKGGGILFYHNVTYISPYNQDFRHVLGAVTQGHPPIRPFKVKVVNSDHPITRGISDFVVTDEQHYVMYDKDPKYVLLRSVNEDGLAFTPGPWEMEHLPMGPNSGKLGTSCEAGWAYDYGKGRVCYLAPGHMIVDLWNPEYEKLQQNAVRWLLHQV